MTSRNQRKKRANKKNNVAARAEQARTSQSPRAQSRPDVGIGYRRSSTETKPSYRTTELAAYVVTVLAIIMTALAVDADGEGGRDPFGAETAIRYITYLTVGYMVARGLAKSGSWNTAGRDSDDERHDVREVHHDHEPDHVAVERGDADSEHAEAPRSPRDGDAGDEPDHAMADDVDRSEDSHLETTDLVDERPEDRDRNVQH